MMNRNTLGVMTLAWAFAVTPPAVAQQDKGSQMSGMQGHNMGSMDMQGMMNQCAQMRQRMKTGARMNADAKKMMQQCDQMDQQMGNTSNGSEAPRVRTR